VTAAHCTDNFRSRELIITTGHRSSSLRRTQNERFTQVKEVEAIIEHFGKASNSACPHIETIFKEFFFEIV